MKPFKIAKYHELCELQKRELIEVFIEGFGHLMNFTKDKEVLQELFLHAIHEDYMLAYVEDDIVLGIIGIATNKIRPIKLDRNVCIKLFGNMKGKMLCKQMNGIFQGQVVNENTDLYIDILATSKVARGKGIATKLLTYCFDLPEYEEYYIEVLSKNQNAKALYEKMGFEVYKKNYISSILLLGFGYPIKMKKSSLQHVV